MTYIILDRDGVINDESDQYIKSPDEWHPIPGSLEAIVKLNRAGFNVLVATNQSGLGRGLYDLPMLNAIHEKCFQLLDDLGGRIEAIYFCPHLPEQGCECRKPALGLFYQMREKYPISFSETYFIGDSLCDIEAADKIGCKPILVLTGNGKATLDENPALSAMLHFENLLDAVNFIVKDLVGCN